MRLVQVSVPSGAGQCTQRRRSDFALLTCARNRHPGPFSGAGPHHQNGPAPFTSPTCTVHRSLLRHPLHPPAPLTLLTCTTHPLTPPTCTIHRTHLRHWLHDLGHSRAQPPLAQCAGPYSPNGAAARNHVRRLPAHGTATSQYAARWLAETLSGSARAPLKGPRGFRFPSGIYSRGRMLFSQRMRRTSSLRS